MDSFPPSSIIEYLQIRTFAEPSVTALKNVDFPAEGFPTHPTINSQPGIRQTMTYFPYAPFITLPNRI